MRGLPDHALAAELETAPLIGTHQFGQRSVFEPGRATVANDVEQPSLGVSLTKATEMLERVEDGLFGDVLRCGVSSQNPVRQIERGVEMRKHEPLEIRGTPLI